MEIEPSKVPAIARAMAILARGRRATSMVDGASRVSPVSVMTAGATSDDGCADASWAPNIDKPAVATAVRAATFVALEPKWKDTGGCFPFSSVRSEGELDARSGTLGGRCAVGADPWH